MLESTEHRLDEVHFYPISNNGDNEVHQTEPYLLPSSAPNEHSVSVEVSSFRSYSISKSQKSLLFLS